MYVDHQVLTYVHYTNLRAHLSLRRVSHPQIRGTTWILVWVVRLAYSCMHHRRLPGMHSQISPVEKLNCSIIVLTVSLPTLEVGIQSVRTK